MSSQNNLAKETRILKETEGSVPVMRRKTSEVLKNERGAALIFVILALVIVSILAMAIASLVRSNLSQTVSEEDTLKAYYLAVSGQDLTYAALLQEDVDGDTLVDTTFSEAAHASVSDVPTLTDTLGSSDGLEGGSVTVTVRGLDIDGERWVEIRSTATLESSSITKTVTLQFLAENPLIQMKS
jgi:type II secretory pathway component PulK